MKPYRPSNGTEGSYFESSHCLQCINSNPNPNGKKQCEIWHDVHEFDISNENYPKEWIYDQSNKPTCTAWKKWDWDNDGDPDDPENPKAPIPVDPNQLCFPWVWMKETKNNQKNY